MILHTEDPKLIAKLLLSGWERGEDNHFYWPGKMPRA